MKYKVALVVDVFDWAFYRIAKQIKRCSTNDNLNYTIIVVENLDIYEVVRKLRNRFDLVHVFWRLGVLGTPNLRNDRNSKLTTAVYDHLFITDKKISNKILSSVDGVYFSSNRLRNIYDSNYKNILPKVVSTCEDGVDYDFFSKFNYTRTAHDSTSRRLKIIWVGNPKWNASDEKGFSIYLKLVELFKQERSPINFYAPGILNKEKYARMPVHYSEADIYICTSKSEGTPNPLLEAMASGCAFITTDVGIVPEVASESQRNFIARRSVEDFATKILLMADDRRRMLDMMKENNEIVKLWDWKYKVVKIEDFFVRVLNDY